MNSLISVDNSLPDHVLQAARKRIRLGLCCINNTLAQNKPNKIYVNRTCDRKHFTVEKALDLSLKNVQDIIPILKWNHEHHITHYRMSSDMFPHYTDSETQAYTLTPEIIRALQDAGEFAKQHNHRLTMHPGQYCVVGTPTPSIFQKTIQDLEMHAMILDQMQVGPEGILCIHGGGVYGDKENTMRRWIDQFDEMPAAVKRRVAIENCEKSYSVEDCLYLAESCKIPMIYDSHHYYCYQYLHPNEEIPYIEELMPFIVDTWSRRDCNPLFHISDQAEDKPIGSHHDYINEIPAHMLSVPYLYDTNIDIEVEAKAKELAIFQLMNRYNSLFF